MRQFRGTALLAPALIFACVLRADAPPSTTIPSDANFRARPAYETYMHDYLTWKHGHPIDIIFIGDSITEMWRWGPGHDIWRQHFEERALDFGLGGDRTQDVLWRLAHYDLGEWSPKVAVVMIGTNNTQDTPDDIAAGVRAVIDATERKFRGIKVILVSILPNARANAKMMTVNERIKTFADNSTVYYLDLAAKFPSEGDSWKGLGRDKLHLTPDAYAVWARELEALLPRVMK